MLGIFGRIITKTAGNMLQLDPPEIVIISQLNA
jgi:hypothetical protein